MNRINILSIEYMINHLRVARMLTDLLENKFGIGRLTFGFDPILGLIPGFGDLIALSLSMYLVWIGIKLRLPHEKLVEMLSNVLIDFLIGLVPVIGDMTDVIFKANSKNIKILKEYSAQIIEAEVVG